jgi:hypothetical protein
LDAMRLVFGQHHRQGAPVSVEGLVLPVAGQQGTDAAANLGVAYLAGLGQQREGSGEGRAQWLRGRVPLGGLVGPELFDQRLDPTPLLGPRSLRSVVGG